MHSRTSLSLLCVTLFTSSVKHVHSRHVHHKPLHKHVDRAETPTPTWSDSDPTLSSEIQAIQSNLDPLPNDILRLITDFDQRLQQIEGLLANLLSSLSVSSTPTSTMSSTASMGQALSSLESAAATASAMPIACIQSGTVMLGPCPTAYAMPSPLVYPTSKITPPTSAPTSHGKGTAAPTYTFRADASGNVAVYDVQTANTTAGGLATLCHNPNFDIIVLAFVNDFFAGNGNPGVNFGPACDLPNAAQMQKAPGLLDCPRLATEITTCQKIGKPVLVSLGGYNANTGFNSNAQATTFAKTLWNLFGAGNETMAIRPFGPNVTVDGFDIDNENHNTTFYNTFATALRSRMSLDKSKKYYISAVPQCPMPDESIPLQAMHQADFVWVQFYNNPSCDLNSTGFSSSFDMWSKQLQNGTSEHKPRLYVGGGAFAGAGSGYVPSANLRQYTDQARDMSVNNLGGMMLWDGTMGLENVDEHGHGYLHYAKAAMQ